VIQVGRGVPRLSAGGEFDEASSRSNVGVRVGRDVRSSLFFTNREAAGRALHRLQGVTGVRPACLLGVPNHRSKLAKELIDDALEKAKIDEHPAFYEVMGSLFMRKEDGTTKRFVLFHPWGHYKDMNSYKIADFAKLSRRLRKDMASISEGLKQVGERGE
jgi:hypothetical protein